MTVSLVIPVYNVTDYIDRCLRSVLQQTYDGLMECILVDDCSPDDSIAKAERIIAGADSRPNIRFRVVRLPRNRGLSVARNTGLDASTGDYIFFLDSDDELLPDAIRLMMDVVGRHPDVQLVQGAIRSIPDNPYYHTDRYNDLEYITSNPRFRSVVFSRDGAFPCTAWNKLLSRSFLMAHGLYFLEGIIHEDEEWMFRLSRQAVYVSFVPVETLVHHSTPNSIISSNGFRSEKSCRNWAKILEIALTSVDDVMPYTQVSKCLFYYHYRYRIHPVLFSQCRQLILRFFTERRDYRLALLFRLAFAKTHYNGEGILRRYFYHLLDARTASEQTVQTASV